MGEQHITCSDCMTFSNTFFFCHSFNLIINVNFTDCIIMRGTCNDAYIWQCDVHETNGSDRKLLK